MLKSVVRSRCWHPLWRGIPLTDFHLGPVCPDQRFARQCAQAQIVEAHERGCREEHSSEGRGVNLHLSLS